MSQFPVDLPESPRLPRPDPIDTDNAFEQPHERRRRRREAPGFSETLGSAIQSEWFGPASFRWYERHKVGSNFDPNWNPTEQEIGRLTHDIPTEYLPMLEEALSAEHASKIRNQIMAMSAHRDTLARAGYTGTALSIGAALFDPGAMILGAGATLAAGPAGGGAVAANKAGRFQSILRSAVAAGTTNAAVESVLATEDPERDGRDIVLAMLAGGAFGAGFDAFATRGRAIAKMDARAQESLQKAVDRSERVHVGAAMGAAGDGEFMYRNFKSVFEEPEFRRRMKLGGLPKEGITPERLAAEAKKISDDADLETLGLAQQEAVRILRDEGDDDWADLMETSPDMARDFFRYANTEGPETVKPKSRPVADDGSGTPDAPGDNIPRDANGTPVREHQAGDLDIEYQKDLGDLDMQNVRFGGTSRYNKILNGTREGKTLLDLLIPDALRRQDGTYQRNSAMAEVARGQRMNAQQLRALDEVGFRNYRKEQGIPFHKSVFNSKYRKQYDEAVTHARRNPDAEVKSAAVKQAAAEMDRIYKRQFDFAKRHGVPGFEDATYDPTYVQQLPSPAAFSANVAAHGRENVVMALKKAIHSKYPEVFDDPTTGDQLLTRWAEGYLRTVENIGSFSNARNRQLLRSELVEDVLALIEENGGDPKMVAAVRNRLKNPEDAANNPRAKHRTELDLNVVIKGDDEVAGTPLYELFENNSTLLAREYQNQILHASAEQRLVEQWNVANGIRNDDPNAPKTIDDIITRVKKSMDPKDLQGMREVDLDQLPKLLRGEAIEPNSGWAQFNRIMRNTVLALKGGSIGMAQIPEVIQSIAANGHRASLASIPSFRQQITNLKKGINTMPDDDLSTLASLGVGVSDHVRNGWRLSLEDHVLELQGQGGGKIDKLDRGMHRLARSSMKLGGTEFMDANTRAMFVDSTVQRMWLDARKYRKSIDDALANAKKATSVDVRRDADGTKVTTTTENGVRTTVTERPGQSDLVEKVDIVEEMKADMAAGRLQLGTLPKDSRIGRLRLTEGQMRTVLKAFNDWEDAGALRVRDSLISKYADLKIDDAANSNPEAFRLLGSAINNLESAAVVRPDSGTLHPAIARSPLLKTIVQFRTFSASAHEKLLLSGIQHRDATAALQLTYGMAVAGMVYTAQEYFKSLGEDDPQAYRDEKLAADRIAAIAFRRAGIAGLMPDISDDITGQFLGKRFFDGRNTGYASTIVDPRGAAVFGTIDDALRTVGSVGTSWQHDKELTERDIERAGRLVPWHTFPFIDAALKALAEQFPEDE